MCTTQPFYYNGVKYDPYQFSHKNVKWDAFDFYHLWVSITLVVTLCHLSLLSSISSMSSLSLLLSSMSLSSCRRNCDLFYFFNLSQNAAQICFKFCVDVPCHSVNARIRNIYHWYLEPDYYLAVICFSKTLLYHALFYVPNALLQVQSIMSRIPLSQYTDTCFVVLGMHEPWSLKNGVDALTTLFPGWLLMGI